MNLSRPYENLTKHKGKILGDKSLDSEHKLQSVILDEHRGKN